MGLVDWVKRVFIHDHRVMTPCDHQSHYSVAYTASGNTTDTLTKAAGCVSRSFIAGSVFVKNTGDTNNMDYEIRILPHETASGYYVGRSGTLAPGETAYYEIPSGVGQVEVWVKSTTAGAATSYTIDTLLKA
ncbi:MAG: hypothetical protein J7L14_03815 [Candidatus Diapherotrites archaeon]|nr:hypothetical protein [Candidatus Diapherotrites archaeon]